MVIAVNARGNVDFYYPICAKHVFVASEILFVELAWQTKRLDNEGFQTIFGIKSSYVIAKSQNTTQSLSRLLSQPEEKVPLMLRSQSECDQIFSVFKSVTPENLH